MAEYLVKCRNCGKLYSAQSNRIGLCNDCKALSTANSKHKYYEKRKAKGLPLKNEPFYTKCEVCGKGFYSDGGQKICSVCARQKNIADNNAFRSDNTDSLSLRVPKGMRDEMKQIASDNGLTLTSLVMRGYYFEKTFLDLPPEKQQQIRSILYSIESDEHE